MQRLLSVFVLIAFVAGLSLGAWLRVAETPLLVDVAHEFIALGGMWLDALRMTIMPLIFALLVTSVANTASVAASGRLALHALALFAILILGAAVYGVIATKTALALWPINPQDAAAITSGAPPADQAGAPGIGAYLRSLIPANPLRAATEDSILQVVVFALFFGFAAAGLPEKQRAPLTSFFDAVGAAMIKIVHWVLLAAPIGVFALALDVGLSAGASAARVLGQYILIVASIAASVSVWMFVLAVIVTRIAPQRFASACIPVWAIAASSQSSVASLPAMLEAATRDLKISERTADFVLPLAVAVFRITSPVANLAVALFIAALYGLEPSFGQLAASVLVAFAVSVSTVGLPGQVSFIASIAPICITLGLPIELLGVFVAVEVFPDIFRTLGNVTADMTATAMLDRKNNPDQA